MDKNRGIGYNNQLPWFIKEDLLHFYKLTTQKKSAIIMGRKTWESLPKKPLPKRLNIILSKQQPIQNNATIFYFKSISDLLKHPWKNNMNFFVIGGETIYQEFIHHPLSHAIYLTEINHSFLCDRFFPQLSSKKWILSWESTNQYYRDITFQKKISYQYKYYKKKIED